MAVIPHRRLQARPFDALICHAGIFGNNPPHLSKHFGGRPVRPESGLRAAKPILDAPGQVADDLPIGARLAARLQGLAHALDAAVGVGERAFFFRPGSGRQEHVRKGAGLVDEQILRHQEFQLLHLWRVSFRFGSDIIGFSPMMYSARTPPGPDRAQDLGGGQPAACG